MSIFDRLVRRPDPPALPPLPPVAPKPDPLRDAIAHAQEAEADRERERRVAKLERDMEDVRRRIVLNREDIDQLKRERGIRP